MIKVSRVQLDYSKVPKGTVALFFGAPKSGKTTAASSWSEQGTDKCLVIDTDLGTDYVEGVNRIIVRYVNPPLRLKMDKDSKVLLDKNGLEQWEEVPLEERVIYDTQGEPMNAYALSEVLEALFSGNEAISDFDTIVLDTIDEINSWVEKDVLASRGLDAMGDGEFGVDWSDSKKKVKRIIELLKNYVKEKGKTLILISHSKQRLEDKKPVMTADLPSGLANVVAGICDIIAYIYIDEKGKHKMSFKGTNSQQFGSRMKPLAGKILDLGYQFYKKEITNYVQDK
ncbi:MAG: hypothetical protein EOM67_13330 [Spirochaetia bacterium]|nr:hypothetical protein [Spirochaetia bacterium]